MALPNTTPYFPLPKPSDVKASTWAPKPVLPSVEPGEIGGAPAQEA